MMPATNEPLVKLASRIAEALQDFVRESTLDLDLGPHESGEVGGTPLGPRQQQAFDLLRSATEDGLKTSQLADAMGGYDVPNAYLTLRSLENRGLVELIPGSRPQRWRAVRDRGSSAPYLAAAQMVREGEWVTYGDISVAVRGDDKAARAVGRAAANLAEFPNPHRVLQAGGVIPPGWHTSDGLGPEECRRRLEAEGVQFAGDKADSARHLAFDELRDRLRAAGVDVPSAA
jgi:alkylated DNA nucleotide flippase Atl1